MRAKKNFTQRFFSPTPKKWKRVSATFFSLSATVTASYGAASALNITMPEWFGTSIGFAIAIFVAIGTYAQQHEIKTKEMNPTLIKWLFTRQGIQAQYPEIVSPEFEM